MRRAFITGITGFVGSHLAELLISKSYQVYGLIRFRADMENIKHIQDKLKLYMGDITDINSLRTSLGDCKPQEIYHLAANSFVPYSWTQPVETFNTNCIGFINLLETVRLLGLDSKIMIAGSSEEYGLVHENEVPITEEQPLRPLSPYAVSKIAMDMFAQQYVSSYNMQIFISRGFNHTGPRRGEDFVCSNFAKQAVECMRGKRKSIVHGDLSAVRDFTDVRDMVRAYMMGLNSDKIRWGKPYNIATGEGVQIQTVLNMVRNFTKPDIKDEEDPSRMRPSDVPLLIGDALQFRAATGWKPEIPFNQTIQDLVAYWRERV